MKVGNWVALKQGLVAGSSPGAEIVVARGCVGTVIDTDAGVFGGPPKVRVAFEVARQALIVRAWVVVEDDFLKDGGPNDAFDSKARYDNGMTYREMLEG